MSRRTARRRREDARRAKGRILGVAEISYLASIEWISRADAERELERTLRASASDATAEIPLPKSIDPEKFVTGLLAEMKRHPTVEWAQCLLEIATNIGMTETAETAETAEPPTAPTQIVTQLPDGTVVAYTTGTVRS